MGEEDHFPEDAPRPRQCHLTKWPEFDGYGFNLHAEKSKPGQYVGKVDPGSPAEYAGLKEGDRIVEVNGVNINHENHKQVVQRIKAMPNETTLLVVDLEAEEYYRQRETVVRSTMSNVWSRSSDRDKRDEDEQSAAGSVDKDEKLPPPPSYEESTDKQEAAVSKDEKPKEEPEKPEEESSDEENEKEIETNAEVHSEEDNEKLSEEEEDPKKEKENVPEEPFAHEEKAEDTVEEVVEEIPTHDEAPKKASSMEGTSDDASTLEAVDAKDKETVEESVEPIPPVMKEDDVQSVSSEGSEKAKEPPAEKVEETPPPKHRHVSSSGSAGMTPSPRSTPSPDHTLQSQSSRRSDWDGLNLNMSAAEMRERIGSRKKRDPRKDDRMDFKTKHDIILSL